MGYEILKGTDICEPTLTPFTMGHFERLMEIDNVAYGGEEKGADCEYVGEIDGYINRFGYREQDGEMVLDPNAGCADNMLAVAENGRILGYINYLTMGEELHHEILHPNLEAYLKDQTIRDDGITGDQLVQWSKEKPNHLFILSITIDKPYQDTDVIKTLSEAFVQELRAKEAEGYMIGSITGDTVSDHGEKAMRMFRCEPASPDGKPLTLPAMESDASGHEVTVVIADGERLRELIRTGLDIPKKNVGSFNPGQREKLPDRGSRADSVLKPAVSAERKVSPVRKVKLSDKLDEIAQKKKQKKSKEKGPERKAPAKPGKSR